MFQHRHLLGIEPLSPADITAILDLSDTYVDLNKGREKHLDVLSGLTQINLFFENSTRTMASFELAGKRLGADVMNMAVQGVLDAEGRDADRHGHDAERHAP